MLYNIENKILNCFTQLSIIFITKPENKTLNGIETW